MSSQTRHGQPAADATARPVQDRRRAPRLRLLGEIHGTRVGLDIPLDVLDLSRTGFAVESGVCFPVGDIQCFEFRSVLDDSRIILRARSIRSDPVSGDRAVARFHTGFEFTGEQPWTTHKIMGAWLDLILESVANGGPNDPRGHERRRLPRLEVVGDLFGEVEDVEVPFVVRDISAGGLCVETHSRLMPGGHHRIWLQLRDQLTLTVEARITYCRNIAEGAERPRFLLGLEFRHRELDSRRAVAAVLDQLTAALVFDDRA